MANTSETKEYSPLVREIIDEAFEICGQDPQNLEDQALRSARRSLNQILAEWIGDFTPLWLTKPIKFTMEADPADVESLPQYPADNPNNSPRQVRDEQNNVCWQFPKGTEQIRALSIRLDMNPASYPVPLASMSDEDWNNYPIRSTSQTGQPYWYWFRRNDPPLLYVVYAPDRPYNFEGIITASPDAIITSNENADIPRRWQSALVWALARKLAIKLNVDANKMQMIYAEAQSTYAMATGGEDDGISLTMLHGEFM